MLKDAKEVGVGRGLGQRPSRTISTRFTQPQNRPVVLTQNLPPVANAGPDRNAYTAAGITLLGSATDPENDPIVYWIWTVEQTPAAADYILANEETPNPLFRAATTGDYVLSLIVGDPYGFSMPDFVTIHVADNLPPVAVATADKTTITVGGTVFFDGSQSYDPEGGPLAYLWDFADGSPYLFGTSRTSHTFTTAGTYNVLLMVTDERSANDTDIITITVLPSLELSVANASVTWTKKGTLGTVDVAANFAAPLPAAGDTVRMTFDGVSLFAAPFGAFVWDRKTGAYGWQNKDAAVSINFAAGTIAVHCAKAVMTGFDPANGVDVQLDLGPLSGVQNIPMVVTHGGKLVYQR